MDARGRISSAYGGRVIQVPGMMRHGPPHGPAPAGHRPSEPLLPTEQLEKKVAVQEAEMERLAQENRRLAASNVAMRQDLAGTQKELQSLQAHLGSIRTETNIQIRGLLEKIGKMEGDMHAVDAVKEELQQAHLEARKLVSARQELTAEIQLVTEELQKSSTDFKKLPELHSELDVLRQEHQKLRAIFEYEKGLNIEQVERMLGMEKNLMSMASEVERLKAEVTSAQQRINAPNQYGGTYPPPVGQPVGYADNLSNGVSYIDGGYVSYIDGGYVSSFGNTNPAHYSEAHAIPQAPINSGAVVQGADSYIGNTMNTYGDMNTYGGPQAH